MRSVVLSVIFMLLACSGDMQKQGSGGSAERDEHSYARPAEARATHVDLDLQVDFEARQLRGACTLDLAGEGTELTLDTRDLAIESVEAADEEGTFHPAPFELGPADPVLGAPLRIERGSAERVRVHYATGPRATALQWLEPRQTADRRHPFLYTQSQAIHARSWIPLQDTPGVRVTYSARIRTPPELLAVMSAEMLSGTARGGDYRFRMTLPVPAYLIALAVGDLVFEATGERSGVYAEPSLARAAAQEFEDTEAMMQAVEALYGPYRWGRYDILVLPPSFPFGGMENPRLTFVSPTVIAGDKSLVSLIAHELAHSWSGNLTTNATWRDFWLNEGFTVYLEERIQEEVYGAERAAMESALEVESLREELAGLDERDQILHVDLTGRDPDDGFTGVPYVKGAMFLRTLEKAVGRADFDAFLRDYFEEFAFRSVTTGQFAAYLERELLATRPEAARAVPVEEWLERPGLPEHRHEPQSAALEEAEARAAAWVSGSVQANAPGTEDWTTQHWLRFLRALPDELGAERLAALDAAHAFTESGNSEILCQWLLLAVRHGYTVAEPTLKSFLLRVGRRKFLRPLYEELAKTERGRERALAIYREARGGYHPMATQSLDPLVGWSEPAKP